MLFLADGFRWVEVTGATGALNTTSTVCFPLRSDVAQTSTFASSSDLLDRVHAMSVNTEECNMMSLQSDCAWEARTTRQCLVGVLSHRDASPYPGPHRERLGYGGDALMTAESFIHNFDVAAFYEKRVRDYADAQRANGGFTETAPFVGIEDAGMGGGSGPIGWQTFMPVAQVWAACGLDLPDHVQHPLALARQAWLLKYYGNLSVLADTYESAAAYCAFLNAAPASAIENGLGDWMGLEVRRLQSVRAGLPAPHVPIVQPSALALTGHGFQAMSYAAFSNVSAALGHAAAAADYATLAADVGSLINSRFLDQRTGVYADTAGGWNATQCGQALPLFLGIVPANVTAAAAAVLGANVAAHGGHLQVGGFGMKWLLESLAATGQADAAYRIMTATDCACWPGQMPLFPRARGTVAHLLYADPSFGYMLNGSANGLGERKHGGGEEGREGGSFTGVPVLSCSQCDHGMGVLVRFKQHVLTQPSHVGRG